MDFKKIQDKFKLGLKMPGRFNLGFKTANHWKEQKVLYVNTVSPVALKVQLSQMTKSEKDGDIYLCLEDTNVLVRSFQFENIALSEVEGQLQGQVVELLGLPLEDIVFDFQVLHTVPGYLNGIFLCLSKKLLEEYIAVLDQSRVVAAKITAGVIKSLERFLGTYDVKLKRFCFLDFSAEHLVNIAIFNQSVCELIRNIPCDNMDHAKLELVQSLRSVCAKSHVKKFDSIYVCGEKTDENSELFSGLEQSFDTKLEWISFGDISQEKKSVKPFFSLNLASRYLVPLPLKRLVYQNTKYVLGGCACFIVLFGISIILRQHSIHTLRNSFSKADYAYAMVLQEQAAKMKK